MLLLSIDGWPNRKLLPLQVSNSGRPLTLDTIEGKELLHDQWKLLHEKYIEYIHRVCQLLPFLVCALCMQAVCACGVLFFVCEERWSAGGGHTGK